MRKLLLCLFLSISTFGLAGVLPPGATISIVPTAACLNATGPTITFTGSGGTAPYTFVYQLNGGANQNVVSNGAGVATVGGNTASVGVKTYTLVSVTDANGVLQNVSGSDTFTVNSPPTVDFTFNNNNTCSGTNIQFTSAITGTGPYSYSWNFGDGTPTSSQANPIHSFTSLGCGIDTFTVTLTVSTPAGCEVTRSHTISVKQKPDINFEDVNNLFDPFSNCGNAASDPLYNITVGNISATTCTTSYGINWGDGNSESNVTFPISHTYSLTGVYSMVITANGSNGCVNTKTYLIKNISNPLGGINSPGSTQNLCAPTANLQFAISNWGTNSLDTTYTVNYGDGTPILILSQTAMIASSYYNASIPVNSANYPIPHIYTTSSCPAASFQVTLDVTNACGTTPLTLGNISILTKPQADFTNPPEACVNTPVTFTNTTIAGYGLGCANTAIFKWDFGDGTPIITTPVSTAQNITHNYTTPGTYTITLTAQNSCGLTSQTHTICIEPPVIPQFTLNTTSGCGPVSVSATNTTSVTQMCSPPTAVWSVTHVPDFCGTTTATIPNQTGSNANWNFTEAGTYSISLSMTNSCGTNTSAVQTVTVRRPPTATLASIPDFCSPGTITPSASINTCAPTGTPITYAWSFPGGSPASSSAANPGSVSYATPGNYTISLVVTNDCGSSGTISQNFTVNATPVITNTNLSFSGCSGVAMPAVNLISNVAGTTYTWTGSATTGVTGFAPSGTANVIPAQTLVYTGSGSGTLTYTVTPSADGCMGTPVSIVFTVTPAPQINQQPQSQVMCINETPNALTIAISGSVVPTYQWYSNTANSTIGGTLISGATSASYIPPTNVAGIRYYYCVISLLSGGCSELLSQVAAITVEPLPLVTLQPVASQTLCTGGTLPAAFEVLATGGTGTITYQWYSNASSSNTGGTSIGGATAATYTPGIFNTTGNYYYYVVATASGIGCGSVSSSVAHVEVVADPVITTQPITPQQLCQGATAQTLTVAAAGGLGTFIYQWYSNPSNSNTGGTAVSGATSASYVPPTSAIGTLYYYCVVSQITPGCSVTSNTAAVIVNVSPSVTDEPDDQEVCLNGTLQPLSFVTAAGQGTPTYQWFSNTTDSNTGGTPISGETNATFTPSAAATGITYYYAQITFSGITGLCATIKTQAAQINVVPSGLITVQPSSGQSMCVGGTLPAALTVAYTGGSGTPTYQWYSNTVNSNVGGTAVATSASYLPPVFTADGDYFYYVEIAFASGGCGIVKSSVAQITVEPDPVVSIAPTPEQILCTGSPATLLTAGVTGGLGTISYQWYSNTADSTSTGTAITGENNATYLPLTTTVGTKFYYVVATQNVSGCQGTSQTVKITVNTSPSVSTQPQDVEICVDATAPALSFATQDGIGTATYQWYSNNQDLSSGGSLITGETSATFTPATATVGQVWYYATISFSGIVGPCATITTQAALVDVKPAATLTQQPQPDQIICVGGSVATAFEIAYTGGSGTPVYQWYSNTSDSNSGGTAISGATSNIYLPPVFTTSGPHYFYATVTLSGSGCAAVSSEVVTITVIPDPTVAITPATDQILCENSGAETLTAAVANGTGTPSYQWYSNTSASTTGATALMGETAATFTPPSDTIGVRYYYVVVSQDVSGCGAESPFVKITVNTSPSVVNQPVPSEVCIGGTPLPMSFTTLNGAGNATYQWYVNTTNMASGGNLITGETGTTFNPPATSEGTLYYYAEITFDGIDGPCATIFTNTAEVIVNPQAAITQQPLADQTLCVGGSLPAAFIVAYSGGSGTPSYQWFVNSTNTTSGGTAVGTNTADYLPPAFDTAGIYYYYAVITLTGNGCGVATSDVAAVNVVADPSFTQQPLAAQTVCQGETPQSLTVAATGGVGSVYEYQWFESASNAAGSGMLIPGAIAANFTPPSTIIGTLFYYCVVSQPGDTGCSAESSPSALTVSPAPNISSQPVGQTVCIDEPVATLGFTMVNGVGTPNYQWFSNTSATNTGGTAISGATSAQFTPSSAVVGTFYFYAEIQFPDLVGSCAEVVTDAIEIIILQDPVISDKADVICSATSFTIDATDFTSDIVPAGTTFTWSDPVVLPAGSVTGAVAEAVPQTSISQQLINTTTSPSIVTYTINPIAGACPGDSFTITVTVNPAINPNIVLVDNLCFDANTASITTNVTGGIPFPGTDPYQYDWNGPNGFTSAQSSISNLEPGSYTVTILDAGGCPFTQTYTITEPAELVFDSSAESDVTCFGFADGTIQIAVSGGTLPYVYSWTKDTGAFSSDQNLSALAPGIYEVTVTDANNCGPVVRSFTITQPQPLIATVANQVNVECFGDSTGQIDINVAGGTPIETSPGVFDYQYSWTGPNGFVSSTKDISGLFAGSYDLTVTDANNCQFSLPVAITSNPEIIISYTTTEISCYGANDATMIVTISGGEAPYSFTWSNLSTLLTQTNLSAGNYTINVTDAFGCTKSSTVVIPEAPIFTVDPVVTQISCFGANDGSIQLNLTGGIAPVTMIWNDGSQAGLTRNALAPGTYTATITDAKPCVITRTFIIVQPQLLAVNAVVTDALDCTQTNTGAIDLIVSGGTPPYAYSWSTGSITEDLTDLTNGNYAVTVTDFRGCVTQAQYSILRPDPLSVTINTQTHANCETHEVTQDFIASVSGGFPPYQLQWSSGWDPLESTCRHASLSIL